MRLTTDHINFAVVGCGHIGKRHIAVIRQQPECRLIALCDTQRPKVLGLEIEEMPFFSSLEELLVANLDIDVVCICTPNGFHAGQALLALQARKHVVLEKPMALRRVDCEHIIHKALNVGRQVFCVMQNRYSPPIQWLREVLMEKRLGDIHLVDINCYWNRDDRYYYTEGRRHDWHGHKTLDGGVLYTQFAHFVDILYWLFGDIRNISGRKANFTHQHSTDFDDTGIVHFELMTGGLGALRFSTAVWNKNFESSLTILGSLGTVKVGGQYMNQIDYCEVENLHAPVLPEATPPNIYQGYTGSAANHHFVFQNVVDVLMGRKEPTTNALEGMKVVDMIERIYAAIKLGSLINPVI